LILCLPVSAQQPDDVITTNTALVQLNVGVVDKQDAVTSLSRNDFAIYEDGVRRPMQFRTDRGPFSLVLLLECPVQPSLFATDPGSGTAFSGCTRS